MCTRVSTPVSRQLPLYGYGTFHHREALASRSLACLCSDFGMLAGNPTTDAVPTAPAATYGWTKNPEPLPAVNPKQEVRVELKGLPVSATSCASLGRQPSESNAHLAATWDTGSPEQAPKFICVIEHASIGRFDQSDIGGEQVLELKAIIPTGCKTSCTNLVCSCVWGAQCCRTGKGQVSQLTFYHHMYPVASPPLIFGRPWPISPSRHPPNSSVGIDAGPTIP